MGVAAGNEGKDMPRPCCGEDDGTLIEFTERGQRRLSTLFVFLAVVVAAAFAAGGAPVAAQEYYVGVSTEDWVPEPQCKDPANTTCGLRHAIFYAEGYSLEHGSPGIVHVPEGEFFLTIDSPVFIEGSGIIKGAGPQRTIIDGGLYLAGGQVLIEDPVIRDNQAETGGGMYMDDVGRPVILRSVIEDNEATWRGGGIWTQHGVCILQSLIHGNVAGEDGGGAYMLKGGLIVNSTVDGNIAGGYGAGLRVADNLYVRNVTVTNNYTSSPSTDMEAAAGVSIFWAGVEIDNIVVDNLAVGVRQRKQEG